MMTDWCSVLMVLLSQLALWVNNAWSWALANWGGLATWWERQEKAVKILILAGVTLLLGAGAWAAGAYIFTCAGWPSLAVAAFMIVSAIAGLFIGGKRWEAAKADRAQAEVLELRQKVQNLEYQLEQMRRPNP
jgi:hypothetical protein